jgi:hypothetical protein
MTSAPLAGASGASGIALANPVPISVLAMKAAAISLFMSCLL